MPTPLDALGSLTILPFPLDAIVPPASLLDQKLLDQKCPEVEIPVKIHTILRRPTPLALPEAVVPINPADPTIELPPVHPPVASEERTILDQECSETCAPVKDVPIYVPRTDDLCALDAQLITICSVVVAVVMCSILLNALVKI